MTVIRPQLVVELGTHFGCSFFAMCQAVADHDLSTELVAIDTWQGDEHAGFYDDSVFDQFERWGRNSYPGVATRALRMMFDEALSVIDDGTIDLLHIDGLHTYEAVSHDFATWRPKLGPHATVMFHDVAEESGYESSRFWAEISDDSGGFTFVHNFGLGVLTADPALAALLASDEFAQIARYYPAQAAADVREMRIEDDGRLLQDRQAIVEHQAQLIADRDGALAAQAQMIDAKQALIEHQDRLIVDRDDALAAQARRIDDLVAGAADAVPHG
ncbi:MAG: class I SAM-dependent methyltransferase [Ilumatobacteraceae bacterium]